MNDGSHATNVQPAGRWVKVLNQSWPPPEVARRLCDVPREDQIRVRVRVVLETGEEQVEGIATRWAANLRHVCVAINDAGIVSGMGSIDPTGITPANLGQARERVLGVQRIPSAVPSRTPQSLSAD